MAAFVIGAAADLVFCVAELSANGLQMMWHLVQMQRRRGWQVLQVMFIHHIRCYHEHPSGHMILLQVKLQVMLKVLLQVRL